MADDLVSRARALHIAGRLDEAAALLQARLDAVPADAEALHLLGLGADARGEPMRAVTLIGRALALGETARLRCNLAMALLHAGRPEDARAAAARALALRPDYPEAAINLGAALQSLGRVAEAADAFRRATALRPDGPEAWLNLGHALRLLRRHDEAEAAYRRAVALGPALPQARAALGDALRAAGRPTEAEAPLRARLALAPADPQAALELAAALGEAGRPADALALLPAAVARAPASPAAHLNHATALRQLGRHDEAKAAYRRALALAPDGRDALGSLGSLLALEGRLAEAEVLQRRALGPDVVSAYNDLAITLSDAGRPHEALALLDLAYALDPDDPETRQHRAFVLLGLGRLPEGWAEYEHRVRTSQGRGDRRGFAQPQWAGEPLAGRTILLHAEQGLGDTVQCCRFLPPVAARAAAEGGRVLLEVQPPLVRLLQGVPGTAAVLARGEALPPFDLHCPLLSLPSALGTTLETIPPPAALAPPPDVLARWRARLPADGTRRLGVVWAGNPRHVQDRRRSVPFAALAPLWDVPGVRWHALQVGPRAADLAGAPPGVVEDLSPDLADMAETAAALLCLDAVVTPDTAVAHLAGSLGVPTLLLLPHAADWRWLRGRADSPWYPALRLLRQARPLDWAPALREAAALLARGWPRGG